MPEIDASGSVGASDLVPLAQIAHWLLSSDEARSSGLPDQIDFWIVCQIQRAVRIGREDVFQDATDVVCIHGFYVVQ